MEDGGINKEERKLWSYFKKISKPGHTPCLDDNSLAAYMDGRHLWGKRDHIEEHLAACPDCLEKLIQMRSLLTIETAEAPFKMRQKAKDQVSGDLGEADKSGLAWWQLIFQPPKSLAWGVVLLLIVATGIRSGEIIAFSPVMGVFSGHSNNLVESTLDVLGLQDNGVI